MSLISRSFKNALKLKYLWLFGFFVTASQSFSGWNFFRKEGGEKWIQSHQPELLALMGIALLIALVGGFIFWLLKVLGEGALIHGIVENESSRPVTFSDCWSAGTKWFGRLLAIDLMMILAAAVLVVFVIVFLVPLYIVSVVAGVLATVLLLPIVIILAFIIGATKAWAIRLGILNDLRWSDAIAAGWRLLRSAPGRTIGVALSSGLTSLVMNIAFIICLLIIAIPFIVLGYINLWLGLIPGVILGLAITAVVYAIFGTFASSVWTLGFVQLTGYKLAPEIAPDVPAAPTI